MSGRSFPGLRQILWVAASVIALSLVVVAASWLFSPRPSGPAPGPSAFKLPSQKVEKSTFQTEHVEGSTPQERFKPEPGPRSQPATPSPSPSIAETPLPPAQPKPASPAPAPQVSAETPAPKPTPSPPLKAVPPTAKTPEPPAAKPEVPLQTAASSVPGSRGLFGVQVGAFSSPDNARSVKQKLEGQGYKVTLVSAGKATKVVVRGYPDKPSAEKVLSALRTAGYEGAFVVPLE